MGPRGKKGTYYLGRVIKLGMLDDDKIFDAILSPATVVRHGNAWTIINASVHRDGVLRYGYGRLCKFAPEIEVAVIDLMKKAEVRQPEQNVILASSPFVYIPEHSGIAFLHVWNHIETNTFIRRFCGIITETYERFFVECKIEPIADLRTFAIKLAKLAGIYRISAKVFPPNPLFGPLWGSLKDYLLARKTETMRVQEESARDEPLNTKLAEVVQSMVNPTGPGYPPTEPLPIGDAAILMAADGYGTGLVEGRVGSDFVIIRTSETIRNFASEKDPDPHALYCEAREIFEKIKRERHMDHDTT
jgi:hypothetical protein